MQPNLTHIHKKTVKLLNLNVNNKTTKGWIVGSTCPFCGSDEKFGVRFNKPSKEYSNHISFNCFRGSCQRKGGEYILFKHFDKVHEIYDGEFIGNRDVIERKSLVDSITVTQQQVICEKRHPPYGFTRVFHNDYLNERQFESWQYQLYHIGICTKNSFLKNYVVFLVIEDGLNRGYVARSIQSKKWIDSHNNKIKQHNKAVEKSERLPLYLRYINESEVDFGSLVFGLDEINKNHTMVIVVEGITSKANTDRWLVDRGLNHIVCVCTFGKKISEIQINKILSKGESLIEFIFMYDPDAIDSSKKYSMSVSSLIYTTACFLKDKDPGDCSFDQLDNIFQNREQCILFALNKVQKKIK